MSTEALDPVSNQLLQLSELIQTSVTKLVKARATKDSASKKDEGTLPDRILFEQQRTLLAAAGTLTELVSEPQNRLLEVSSQYFEARALHIAADARIADLLSQYGDKGLEVKKIGDEIGIEHNKLSRLLRCLCSIHIFKEVASDVFANNTISEALVGNEHLRAYIMLFGLDLYSSSDYLPRALHDSVKGPSYAVDQTAWQDAVGTTKARWDWLEEPTSLSDQLDGRNAEGATKSAYPGVFGAELRDEAQQSLVDKKFSGLKRPEHQTFSLAMVGGGRVFGQAHLYDYPWESLGNATIVDVGGGVGGFCLQLSKIYPNLKLVVEDRAPAVKKAETEIWPKENPQALAEGRVQFVPHDFFKKNPVEGADVYWLRYIMHDWSDDYCVQILTGIRESMGPRSRVLICDQVMNTTLGCPELEPAPAPLAANWGYYTRYSHQRDLAMMSIINGIERKPQEFQNVIERAGLKLRKIWDCRSQVGLVEAVLPNSELL